MPKKSDTRAAHSKKSDAHAYWLMGQAHMRKNEPFPALNNFALAVVHDPENATYKQHVIDWFCHLEVKQLNPDLKMLLVDCLECKDVRLEYFTTTWLSVLQQERSFLELYNLFGFDDPKEFDQRIDQIKDFGVLLDPFFLAGLGRFIVPSRKFENFITNLRRLCLSKYSAGGFILPVLQDNEFIVAMISRYAVFTEFIWNETQEEAAAIDNLAHSLEQQNSPDLYALMLFGCYRPLCSLKNAQEILENLPVIEDHVSSIPRAQIENYFIQQRLRQRIQSLTQIEDEISRAVQAQYEEFPYPAWEALYRQLHDEAIEGRFKGKRARILIAGCGTGKEALELAAALPDAEITAIDLNRASLGYAIMRSEQLGIGNVAFRHADIMSLGGLDEKFDYITSSGVLHHMRDPKAGWTILRGLLKPKGLMRIALYSRTARAVVIQGRKMIADNAIQDDAASIRRFRADIAQHQDKNGLSAIESFYDYYSLNMCRDLLFHVQEHQFDLPQIKAILSELNLRFLKMHIKSDIVTKFRAENKTSTALTDLDAWHRYEQKNPDTFVGMYASFCEAAD